MTTFISLSSGSNGNCYYIGNDQTAILIDVGIGVRTIKKRLLENDLSIDDVAAILITHDHVDHIKHLGSFTERYMRPVYTTERLNTALTYHFCTRGRMMGCIRVLKMEEQTILEGVKVTPFIVPHDATQTVGYYIDFFGETFTFLTDLGAPTQDALTYAKMADNLIVEANYDVDLLLCGTYTKELKMRIMQDHGHLSNEQTASLIRQSYHKGLKNIYLCHLSQNNNTPDLAYSYAENALHSLGLKVKSDVMLYCLPRCQPSTKFCI